MSETTWHLFVDCPFAKGCWEVGNLWEKIDAMCYEVDTQLELFLRLTRAFEPDEVERAMGIVWAIWRERNNVVWNEESTTPSQVVYGAKVFMEEWKGVRLKPDLGSSTVKCNRWHAPRSHHVKINVDASFFTDSMQMGVGMIMHDDEGNFMLCCTMVREGLLRIDDGEALGTMEALLLARNLGLQNVQVETDSKRVADAFKTEVNGHTPFGDFIQTGKRCLDDGPLYTVTWVCCNANSLAHNLARTARNFDSPQCWVEPPTHVDGLLDRCTTCI